MAIFGDRFHLEEFCIMCSAMPALNDLESRRLERPDNPSFLDPVSDQDPLTPNQPRRSIAFIISMRGNMVHAAIRTAAQSE